MLYLLEIYIYFLGSSGCYTVIIVFVIYVFLVTNAAYYITIAIKDPFSYVSFKSQKKKKYVKPSICIARKNMSSPQYV